MRATERGAQAKEEKNEARGKYYLIDTLHKHFL